MVKMIFNLLLYNRGHMENLIIGKKYRIFPKYMGDRRNKNMTYEAELIGIYDKFYLFDNGIYKITEIIKNYPGLWGAKEI